jgi:hypothetical protein
MENLKMDEVNVDHHTICSRSTGSNLRKAEEISRIILKEVKCKSSPTESS